VTATNLPPAEIMKRDDWVRETQMFQRIAGVSVTSAAELEDEWDAMRLRQRRAASERLRVRRLTQNNGQAAPPPAAEAHASEPLKQAVPSGQWEATVAVDSAKNSTPVYKRRTVGNRVEFTAEEEWGAALTLSPAPAPTANAEPGTEKFAGHTQLINQLKFAAKMLEELKAKPGAKLTYTEQEQVEHRLANVRGTVNFVVSDNKFNTQSMKRISLATQNNAASMASRGLPFRKTY
jgi:hypothetical protein